MGTNKSAPLSMLGLVQEVTVTSRVASVRHGLGVCLVATWMVVRSGNPTGG